MKKIAAILVTLCIFSSIVHAKEENISQVEIKFMDIPWNSTMEYCKEIIDSDESFNFVTHKDICDIFSGDLFRKNTSIVTIPIENTNIVGAIIIQVDQKMFPMETFNFFEGILNKKYGVPSSKIRIYKFPFQEGDCDIEAGVESKNIHILDSYDDIYGNSVSLKICEDLKCFLMYKSRAFSDYFEKKKQDQSKAF